VAQIRSFGDRSCLPNQEISRLSRNPEVHRRVHKGPPLGHVLPPCLRSIFILQARFSKRSPTFKYSDQNCMHVCVLRTLHPSLPLSVIRRRVQTMTLLLMQSSSASFHMSS
jgi:hypothetical protein